MPVTVEGTVRVEGTLGPGLVSPHPTALYVVIAAAHYDIGGRRGVFNGVAAELMTDDDTTYIYLDSDGVFQKSTTGYPSEETYLPLARVVASSGEIAAIHEERILLATSSSVIGLCRVGYPVDAGVRGGTTSASSNNDIAAVRFDTGGDGWNRWNCRPPQNRTSGDLVLRVHCSVPATIGSSKGTRWRLEWDFCELGEALPSSWTNTNEYTKDVSGQAIDELFAIDFDIDGDTEFDASKDFMCFKLSRIGTHGDDDCGQHIYTHFQELRYTGFKLAGQAGQ